jgi:nucleoside-diphosphate-sugar epimerase
MNVFITGGTGFLGTALTQKLLAQGHRVTILTRSNEGRTDTGKDRRT